MCFAPQRRALFRHLNFQKWSDPGVLCAFWLGNVLCATTACTFSSLIWPDGSAPAALASLLFDPSEPQIIGKNTVFRDFPTFSRTCIFFLLPLSPFWSSLFYSSLLSDSSHPCFSSVHIVGSLTSKLPSNIYYPSINNLYILGPYKHLLPIYYNLLQYFLWLGFLGGLWWGWLDPFWSSTGFQQGLCWVHLSLWDTKPETNGTVFSEVYGSVHKIDIDWSIDMNGAFFESAIDSSM